MAWVIDKENKLRDQWCSEWGDEEFARRQRIAKEKRDAIPDSDWKAACVIGGQFESIAMQTSQEIFDKLAKRDHTFWMRLVYKLATHG